MASAKYVCILGIGNVLRKDDGIASQVCSRIADLDLPDVEVRTCHQLQPEMVDELSVFEELVLVDAALQEEPVLIETLPREASSPTRFTHDLDARLFSALMHRFKGDGTRIHLCTVAGAEFGYGMEPSAQGMAHAGLAVERILDWLNLHRSDG